MKECWIYVIEWSILRMARYLDEVIRKMAAASPKELGEARPELLDWEPG
ncbi:hypothetical protein Q5O89_08585 [Peribacillus frigoritolerans]|nr:hypothetical protein [Peribacillus frigoritolerans]